MRLKANIDMRQQGGVCVEAEVKRSRQGRSEAGLGVSDDWESFMRLAGVNAGDRRCSADRLPSSADPSTGQPTLTAAR